MAQECYTPSNVAFKRRLGFIHRFPDLPTDFGFSNTAARLLAGRCFRASGPPAGERADPPARPGKNGKQAKSPMFPVISPPWARLEAPSL